MEKKVKAKYRIEEKENEKGAKKKKIVVGWYVRKVLDGHS